jgi:hypothetical protein
MLCKIESLAIMFFAVLLLLSRIKGRWNQRNEEEFYGMTQWYKEKEIEEREYGLPWYARSESPYRDDEED